jgi:hypothetical protein
MSKAPATPKSDPTKTIALEIDIIVFTLLINLGFLKITEVSTFIGQITTSIQQLDLISIMLIGTAVVAYGVYGVAIVFGLIFTFRNRNSRTAVIIALGGFFVMYASVFVNAVIHAQIRQGVAGVPELVAPSSAPAASPRFIKRN